MRRILLILLLTAVALTGTEIRVAQIDDRDCSVSGEAAESSSRSENRLSVKIRNLTPRLVNLYQRYLDSGGMAKGEFKLSLTIGEDGYVEAVTVLRDRLNDADLAEQAAEMVATWFLGENQDEEHPGSVVCVYPFIFNFRTYYSPIVVVPLDSARELHPLRRAYWVEKEFSTGISDLVNIYNIYLMSSPDLEGTITVEFTLQHDGTVDNTQIVGNTTGSTSLASDIADRINEWRLSALKDADFTADVTVTYPLEFGSVGGSME
ncbi:AgmX/PglI C-terminal domain-containing protein [bacterium]|nr:AgmX/PglI C-terminal domain-containing protein [bacterium]